MENEMSKIIIDDDLVMDVKTGIVGSASNMQPENIPVFPTNEIMSQIDRLDDAITDFESSFDSHSISRLSFPGREGVYYTAGLLRNVVIGVMIALIFIILLV